MSETVNITKRARRWRWDIQIPSTPPPAANNNTLADTSDSSTLSKPATQNIPPPPPPSLPLSTNTNIPDEQQTSLIRSLLKLPHGRALVSQYQQQLLPYTTQYLDQVISKEFVSIPAPAGYKPPTRNQITLLQNEAGPASVSTQYAPQSTIPSSSSSSSSVPSGSTLESGQRLDMLDFVSLDPSIQRQLGEITPSRDDFSIFRALFNAPDTLTKTQKDAYILLLQIKYSSGRQRKNLARALVRDRGVRFPMEVILPPLLQLLRVGIQSGNITPMQQHILFTLLTRLTPHYGNQCAPYIDDLLRLTQTFLLDKDPYVRNQGGSYIRTLTRAVGLSSIVYVVNMDVVSPDDPVRETVARTFAYVCTIVGVRAILPFISALLGSPKPYAVDTGLRTIQKMAWLLNNGLVEHMDLLISAVLPTLERATNSSTLIAVLRTISQICTACTPYICPSLLKVVDIISELAPKCHKRPLVALVECVASYLSSLDADKASQHWDNVNQQINECCLLGDSNSLIIGISAITAAIRSNSVSHDDIEALLTTFVKDQLLVVSHCSEPRNVAAIKTLLIVIAQRIGGKLLFEVLINHLCSTARMDLALTLALLTTDILVQIGADELSDESNAQLAESLCGLMIREIHTENAHRETVLMNDGGHIATYVLNRIYVDGTWSSHPVVQACSFYFKALGPTRMTAQRIRFSGLIANLAKHRDQHVRYQSWVLLSRLVQQFEADAPPDDAESPSMVSSGEITTLKLLANYWNQLFEASGEADPVVLSSLLCALRQVVLTMQRLGLFMTISRSSLADFVPGGEEDPDEDVLGPEWSELSMHSAVDFCRKLFPMLQNRHEFMVLAVTRLLAVFGAAWGSITPAADWYSIVTQHISSLIISSHRCIRKSIVSLVGICAQCSDVIGVIVHLLKLLGNDNRTIRVGATSCIGNISQTCGIYIVLPLLFHAYKAGNFKMFQGVLNTIVVCVQQSSEFIGLLPTALFPLLTHVLSNSDHKIIRKGLTIASSLIIQSMLHNFSESGKALAETVGAYIAPLRAINCHTYGWWWYWRTVHAALSTGLGFHCARALYVGLFHPASRVRDTHWMWYNHILLQKQHQAPMHLIKIPQTGISPVNLTTTQEMVDKFKQAMFQQKQASIEASQAPHDDESMEDSAATSEHENKPIIVIPQPTEYNDPWLCHGLSLPF